MGTPNGYTPITANGTTTIDGAAGAHVKLFLIVFNTLGATGNTMTVTDATTGAAIAVIDTTRSGLTFLNFGGVRVAGGIKIVTATGTAPNATVIWD